VNTKLEVLKLKAEAANCRRVAEDVEGSIREALLRRAQDLEAQIEKENKDNGKD